MACALFTQPGPPHVVGPFFCGTQVQEQKSYAFRTKLPWSTTGASVEIGAGGTNGGLNATSICTMRLEPGFWPSFGVAAKEVSSHTGISTGVCPWHVAPGGITISCEPFQQTCCP